MGACEFCIGSPEADRHRRLRFTNYCGEAQQNDLSWPYKERILPLSIYVSVQ